MTVAAGTAGCRRSRLAEARGLVKRRRTANFCAGTPSCVWGEVGHTEGSSWEKIWAPFPAVRRKMRARRDERNVRSGDRQARTILPFWASLHHVVVRTSGGRGGLALRHALLVSTISKSSICHINVLPTWRESSPRKHSTWRAGPLLHATRDGLRKVRRATTRQHSARASQRGDLHGETKKARHTIATFALGPHFAISNGHDSSHLDVWRRTP